MDFLRTLLVRFNSLFRRNRLDSDLDEELRAHIDLAIAENLKRGMFPEDARTAALRAFGGLTQTRESYRVQRSMPFLEQIARDLQFAFRQLRKSPGFAATAILTLALGIGATAAMFSVIDAVILRPLPYKDVDRIVDVRTHSASSFWQFSSWPGYLGMRRQNSTFQALAGYAPYWGMTLKVGDQTQYVHVTQGTDNFFDVFGVQPFLGRTFLWGEDAPGKNNIVVLSYVVWRQSFHADRDISGKIVNLDGSPYEVTGVMPAGFRFPLGQPNLVYIPVHVRPNWVGSWRDHWLLTIGRLKPEVSMQQANANLASVMNELGRQQPETDSRRTAQLIPITQALHGESELPEVWFMLGAVLAVLLVACINVAGLLMARGIAREREMALRVAIGAARIGLVRQLLVENALLGIIGAGAGLALAAALLAAIKSFLAHAFMRGANASLNFEVVAVTLTASIVSSIAAGLLPAVRASRSDPNRALKSGIAAGTAQSHLRFRAGFVTALVALSLVLVVFSALLLTVQRMLRVDFGFNPRNLLMLGINIPAGDYTGRDYVQALLTPLEERVQAIPGVAAAGIIDQPPLLGFGSGTSQQIVGQPPDPPDHERNSESRSVTPGYYGVLGLPIVRGRAFSSQDTPSSQPVVIVNQAWVKEFLTPSQDPVAHAFVGKPNMAIIGVAHDARQNLPDPAQPEIDFPFSQWSVKSQQEAGSIGVCLFVRTNVPPMSIVPELRKALHDVAPAIAFQTPDTMDDLLDDALVTNRMESWLFGIFAAIAVLLAIIGIHGLLTQEIASRTRDIGLRMALGATRTGIARMMFRRIAALLALGLGIGAFLTVLLRRIVASVLVIQFERDGAIIAGLIAALEVVGFLAALIPIRRAASIDPMRALRTE
ncbi:MAG TPA: ABC transporter permease [Terracidiphilus sp.]|jgi:predicted permease|nr:ABC transporter permease [Terracidiphilus sp.]